jgi:two-component system, NtrC family, sensor kinase
MSKILVVDDDPDITKQLSFKFSKEGYNVVVAVDAYTGIQSARKEKPDLIILDIMLPAGGGLQVLKNIRSMPNISRTPVVILTGTSDNEMRKKIEQEGVEAYLLKPYDYNVLSQTVKQLLGKGESDTGDTPVVDDNRPTSKILVVDDDPDITKQLGFKFSKEGYNVVIAVDAYTGIQSARKEKPDLIILDIMLPAGGGLYVLNKIRSMPDISRTPVVILTGTSDHEMRKKIEQEGVEAYLLKPYDYNVLSQTVKKLLTI